MTCIVGLARGGRVFLGGDSAGLEGWALARVRAPKVFRSGPFVMGYTDSFRMGQILEHAFTPPPLPRKRTDLQRYMVVDFVNALRAALRSGGWAKTKEGQDEGGRFLVGVRGRLFDVCSDFQVTEIRDGIGAVGCGGELARGALYAAGHLLPERRVRLALSVAERCNGGVRGPFHVVSTP